ncbi:MAG: hypothetical protein MZV70_07525 [Desulfobacterales bacterium]|nr:hypothetical protein [Desulfobacterales bacterium]
MTPTSSSAAPASTTLRTSMSRSRATALTVITGLSGSGKSTLAFDTLYAEGQRRYVESLSAYARQFLERMEKPDVDSDRRAVAGHRHRAEDRRPQPALDGRHGHRNLRLPAAALRPRRRAALPALRRARSPPGPSTRWSTRCMALPEGTRVIILAPARAAARKASPTTSCFERLQKRRASRGCGSTGVVVDARRAAGPLDRASAHAIEVVVDRLVVKRADPQPARPIRWSRRSPRRQRQRRGRRRRRGAAPSSARRRACPACGIALPGAHPGQLLVQLAPGRLPEAAAASGSTIGVRPGPRSCPTRACPCARARWPPWAQAHAARTSSEFLEALTAHYGRQHLHALRATCPNRSRRVLLRTAPGEEPITLLLRPRVRAASASSEALRGHHPEPGAPLPRDRLRRRPARTSSAS